MAQDAPDRTEGGNPPIEVVHDRNAQDRDSISGGRDELSRDAAKREADETRATRQIRRELSAGPDAAPPPCP